MQSYYLDMQTIQKYSLRTDIENLDLHFSSIVKPVGDLPIYFEDRQWLNVFASIHSYIPLIIDVRSYTKFYNNTLNWQSCIVIAIVFDNYIILLWHCNLNVYNHYTNHLSVRDRVRAGRSREANRPELKTLLSLHCWTWMIHEAVQWHSWQWH